MAGHHHHVDPEAGDVRVFWAIFVNLVLTVVQILGGLLSGSLALIADAIHNLSDAVSLIIAFFARKIARTPANKSMTFGYGRAEVVAALVNYTTLITIGVYLVYEALHRFFNLQEIDGWLVVVIAGMALAVDAVTAILIFSLSKNSMNMRAAFLHNVADALGSIGVIIAGITILIYDWRLIDPIITLLIAGYILWQSFSEIGVVINILMLGSPPGLDADELVDKVKAMDGIADIHHVHLWQMHEHENSVDAHLVIAAGQWENADAVKSQVKDLLRTEYAIIHSILEIECLRHACTESSTIGHPNQG